MQFGLQGPNALPLRLDLEIPNLGKFAACRRVARTIYLGSAPTTTAANRGLEDRRVKLGCVMPGESPAIFGDALCRSSGVATYLYQDGPRYWYATQPTVGPGQLGPRGRPLPAPAGAERQRSAIDGTRRIADTPGTCRPGNFPCSSLKPGTFSSRTDTGARCRRSREKKPFPGS